MLIRDASKRDPAIDILRALTMCLMIFVNHLWTIHGVPHWMEHAETMEDFMGLADSVYPAFLFAMGMSIPYSLEKRFREGKDASSTLLHIFKRGFSLVLMGVFMVNEGSELNIGPHSRDLYLILMTVGFFLVWNDYGDAKLVLRRILVILGAAILIWMVVRFRTSEGRMMQARWWGILGLIGWAYLACALLYFIVRDRLEVLFPAWVFFIFLCLLFTETRDGEQLLELGRGNFIDSLRNTLHLGNGSDQALAMGGMLLSIVSARHASRWKPSGRVVAGLCAGAALACLGALSHLWFICSKNLATLPWVLWSSAICVVAYTLLQILVRHDLTAWSQPLAPAGKATLTTYMVPEFLAGFCGITGLELWDRFCGMAGILYCIAYVALVLFITYLLGKLHIKLKL
ncbi:MAG: DUF5009 domain-containing protein [Bacteroidales bacterium]|nr:DUF5009 domain-containing protein [Bacteroidales bacterium]